MSATTLAGEVYPYPPVRRQTTLISDHFFTRKRRIQGVFEGERLLFLRRWLPIFFMHVDAKTLRDFWPTLITNYWSEFPEFAGGHLSPQEVDVRVVTIKQTEGVHSFDLRRFPHLY